MAVGGVPAVPAGGTNHLEQAIKAERLAQVGRQSFLRQGDSGEEVRFLQERLAAAGFTSNDAPGTFGADTARAVREFQGSRNGTEANGGRPATVNGNVGDQTWGMLFGLQGEDVPSAGRSTVDRNQDPFNHQAASEFVARDSGAPAGAQPGRPTDAEIHTNVYVALANQSTTDALTPENARQISADVQAGRTPQVPPNVLADLGQQALDARRDAQPRPDYAYPGAQVDNAQFDQLMESVIGEALVASPEAGYELLGRTNDQADIELLNRAFNLEPV